MEPPPPRLLTGFSLIIISRWKSNRPPPLHFARSDVSSFLPTCAPLWWIGWGWYGARWGLEHWRAHHIGPPRPSSGAGAVNGQRQTGANLATATHLKCSSLWPVITLGMAGYFEGLHQSGYFGSANLWKCGHLRLCKLRDQRTEWGVVFNYERHD